MDAPSWYRLRSRVKVPPHGPVEDTQGINTDQDGAASQPDIEVEVQQDVVEDVTDVAVESEDDDQEDVEEEEDSVHSEQDAGLVEDEDEERPQQGEEDNEDEEDRIVPVNDPPDPPDAAAEPRLSVREKKQTKHYGDPISHPQLAVTDMKWLEAQCERIISIAEKLTSSPEVALQLKALDYLDRWTNTIVVKLMDRV